MARSSTISQPTAILPRPVSTSRRSCRARSSTTVEATDRARPKTIPAPTLQPSSRARPRPITVAADLHDRAGDGDLAHRHQVLQREVQADPEHQQDHADLGQLRRQLLVGHIAGGERPDQHAGQQVADEHRQLQPVGDGAEHEGQSQARDDGGDQRGMMQRLSLTVNVFGRTQP
jgi:hypothetical protein